MLNLNFTTRINSESAVIVNQQDLNSDSITVYHGSQFKFEEFNFSKIGLNGTVEGKGIYFTTNKGIASGYGEDGYLYTVKLHMKKSLVLNENNISKQDLKKVFIRLYELDQDALSNWGDVDYDGFNNVLNEAVNNTYDNECDVEMVAGLVNAIGDVELINNTIHEVLGYDSIIAKPEWQTENQMIYIALMNDIIEILNVQ